MQNIRAIVREGRIELLEEIEIPEGTGVLVTPLTDDSKFWLTASESSLVSVWITQRMTCMQSYPKNEVILNGERIFSPQAA